MRTTQKRERLGWRTAVGIIAVVGLALRIAAAHGGLWTDEAWSVIHAAKARDALGVFLRINHDNNHHLYSLWLQAIGPDASPLLARAPAIIAGSACAIVAALFARRHGRFAGILAALLFAVTPSLVVFGSEARGYSMMLLAALLMLLLVGDAVDGSPARRLRWWLAAIAAFGMLSQMTMAAPVGIAALWVYIEDRAGRSPRAALSATLRLMGPALAATVGVILFVFTAAAMSRTGMQLGGYEAFSAVGYMAALDDLILWSVGIETLWPWLIPALFAAGALAIGFRRPDWLGSRAALYALLVATVPFAALLLRAGNTGLARYYLASAIGLLLFMTAWIGRGLAGRLPVRAGAAALILALLVADLHRDWLLIRVDRGRPAAAVADMAALSPAGARIAFTEPRLKAIVAIAAERSGYNARFAGGCEPAEFLLAAQWRWVATPASVERCGISMDAIDSSVTIPLTGDSWVLYRARSLQSSGSADSGPRPGARNRRLSARAGVAQG